MSIINYGTLGVAALCLATLNAQPAKTVKDQEEFAIYNDAIKDIGASNFTKALTDLDSWKRKYPDSDYRDDRVALYVQAFAATNQPAQSVDAAGELLSKDLNSLFPGPAGQATVIRLLYNTSWSISRLPNPTAAELATGERAARQLMAYDQQLPGVTPAQWAEARIDMRDKARAALLHIALLPGIQAMAKQPPDCAAAESAYAKALGDYPDKSAVSYELARALACEAKGTPEKLPLAIYEFERAAVVDPTLGDPQNDPKKIQAFADNSYIKMHGSDEGLDQLKQQAKQSPLPPPGFAIKSGDEILRDQDAEFEKLHPKLALWMKIKAALSDDNGEQYFTTQLKDSGVPQLEGTLVEAKPACHPTVLVVAVPLPGADSPLRPEITLKLAKPLPGKPETHAHFRWEGVPSAFTKDPFMLTMDTDTTKIEGLKTTPCATGAPAKRH